MQGLAELVCYLCESVFRATSHTAASKILDLEREKSDAILEERSARREVLQFSESVLVQFIPCIGFKRISLPPDPKTQ